MSIINSYKDILDSPLILAERAHYMLYHVSEELHEIIKEDISQDCLMLFSGSWKWNLDIQYMEHSILESGDLNFHKNTLFIDPNSDIFEYAVRKIKPKTLAVVHSGLFFSYRKISDIMEDLGRLKGISGGNVLATVPQERVDFNRLTTPIEQLAKSIGASLVGNDLVIKL